jgi:peroxiredoxin Q/BCP
MLTVLLANMATQEVDENELPNVGAGEDPYRLTDAFEQADTVALLLQRDYHCHICEEQTQELVDKYDEFSNRGAEVVVVLPDSRSKAEKWAKSMRLPFPLLADDGATIGEKYGQEVRFGVLGRLHDFVGRMPAVLVLNNEAGEITVAYEYKGDSYGDRPSVDDILEQVDAA